MTKSQDQLEQWKRRVTIGNNEPLILDLIDIATKLSEDINNLNKLLETAANNIELYDKPMANALRNNL